MFSSGGKVWVYGGPSRSSIVRSSPLIVVNDDFTIASDRNYGNMIIEVGTSDGNGHAYFLASL